MAAVVPISGQLVGRARELAAIALAASSARAGNGSVLVVRGAEGSGKTALCEVAAAQAKANGLAVGWSTCWPSTELPPLWPWADATAQIGADPDAAGAGLVAALGGVRAATASQPALLVVDDLHLADDALVDLCRFVAGQVRTLPLVLLLALRTTAEPAPPGPLDDLARAATCFELGGLDPDEVQALLDLRGVGRLTARDLELVVLLTGGGPRVLEQALTRHLATSADAAELPRSLTAAAVAALGPAARRVGAAAAVVGRAGLADLRRAAGDDLDPAAVAAAVVELELAGLVRHDAADHVAVDHPVVAEALADGGGGADLALRAVEVLRARPAPTPADRLRLARHLLALAGPADEVVEAVTVAASVAEELAAAGRHREAAELLREAVELHRDAGLGHPSARIQVALAEAVLRGGHLASARPLFEAAALAADAEDDATSRARAALGLGGVWLNEHRSPIDRQRVLALQRRSRDALGDADAALRDRLSVRLAAEQAYADGTLAPVEEAIDVARARGPVALAEALSLYHHVLLGPAHARTREPVAQELLDTAAVAGDQLLALMGLCWLTTDRFLGGDPLAERSLRELEERAGALPCHALSYLARAMGVMVLMRRGDLAEAEAEATSCFEYGAEIGDADAVAYYGAHLFVIRWWQGRGDEVLGAAADTAASPTLSPVNHGFTAAYAALAAEAGDRPAARAALDRLHAAGFTAIPQNSAWSITMSTAMEAAATLGDQETAAEIREAFAPFADLPVMGSLAVVCLGSFRRGLGLAARTLGDLDDAVAQLRASTSHCGRLGNRPMTAMDAAELAATLVARGGPGDHEEAVAALEVAIEIGSSCGMEPRVSTWRARLAELQAPAPPPAPAPHAGATVGTIGRRGGTWVLAWGPHQVEVPDLLGLGHLAQLLVNPGREIAATTLVGGDGGWEGEQPLLDERAIVEYRQQIRDLQEELAEAEDHADLERAARLQEELDALVAALSGSTGLRGRSRSFATSAERARTAVRKAVRRALDVIDAADPVLGDLLRRSVQTGRTCCYRPGPDAPARWTLLD